MVSAHERRGRPTIIGSPAFASLDGARQYLESIIKAEDDCAKVLSIEVISPLLAACEATVFTVTVTDPRCSEINPIQTVSREYALWVDVLPPTVSIVLERGGPDSNTLYADPEGGYIHIDQGTHDFENTGFSYFIEVSRSHATFLCPSCVTKD